MNPFAALVAGLTNPIETLEHFDAQVLNAVGCSPARIREWTKVHKVYYGKTTFTRKQANAVAVARSTQKSLDQLVLIETRLAGIDDPGNKWELRLALLSVKGDYKTLQRRAEDIVPEGDKPAPEPTVGFGRSREKSRPMNVMGPDKDMAAIEYALRQRVTGEGPAGPQMYEALMSILGLRPDAEGEGDAAPSRIAPAVPRPLILIPLDEHINIIGGDGDDTILGLTDGTTMTGAEYLAQHHGDHLEVALFHPQEGAVNLYDTQRFANRKQRDLARATMPTCPVPDCRHAADNCEVHHITAWSKGGHTNMDNLAMLCRYHNRTNDDDPAHAHRGRVENIRGTPTWRSPRGHLVPNTVHPYGAMTLLYGR
ncbi:HNH endonuclease [Corynebacterium tuscaniense]|uniref:HNH endonuclease signature motif containing protein n=2 Tax=Corynebacterium tuscaniense TaxID=302449 RepID=UPI00123B0058|nr:HNH endonuclease signature motif containing protein [Corynebacterium tuscaniense]KAA8743344.1 HNH endonuclease [Corynebacterium tuscaniense]